MGLKLTLSVENSYVGAEFVDAYWRIDNLNYTTTDVWANLVCYPSRDASKFNAIEIPGPTIPVGTPVRRIYDTALYKWNAVTPIANIFPEGIPLDEDTQKTAVYNWIKSYTGLPFKDVFED